MQNVPQKAFRLGKIDYAVMLGFFFYASGAAVPTIALMRMSQKSQLDFNLTEGGLIHAIRMSSVVVILLVSGFLSGKFGKCRALSWSAFLMAAATAAVAFAPNFLFLLPMVALIGAGHGCLEGLLNPVIQDAHQGDSARYLNFLNGFWSVGLVGTMVIGGELLTRGVSWRTLYFCVGILSVLPAVLFWKCKGTLPKTKPDRAKKTVRQFANVVKIPRFWIFFMMMLLAGGAESAYTYWSAPFFERVCGTTPRVAGFLAALYPMGMFLMRCYAGAKIRQKNLQRFLLLTAVGAIVITGLFPLSGSLCTGAALLTLCGAGIACFWPSLQSLAADELNADSTMIFILLSCAGIPGAGIMVMIMGRLGDAFGLRNSFYAVPVVCAMLALSIMLDGRKSRPDAVRVRLLE